jgi:hypothetical protein
MSTTPETGLPDFTRKVAYICTDGGNVCTLIDATFEKHEGRLFLVGKVAPTSTVADWFAGVRYAVAWDAVLQYAVFDSIEDYAVRVGRYEAAE